MADGREAYNSRNQQETQDGSIGRVGSSRAAVPAAAGAGNDGGAVEGVGDTGGHVDDVVAVDQVNCPVVNLDPGKAAEDVSSVGEGAGEPVVRLRVVEALVGRTQPSSSKKLPKSRRQRDAQRRCREALKMKRVSD